MRQYSVEDGWGGEYRLKRADAASEQYHDRVAALRDRQRASERAAAHQERNTASTGRPLDLVHQIVPDPLERGMAQQPLTCLRAILRVDHHLRLDPLCLGKFP